MRPREELQPHVHSWCMDEKLAQIIYHPGGGAMLVRFESGLILRVAVAGTHFVTDGAKPADDTMKVVGVNIHPRAGTFTLILGRRQRVLDKKGFPGHFLVEHRITVFLKVAQPQPVKVFKQGRDVTGEFKSTFTMGGEEEARQRAKPKGEQTWTTDPVQDIINYLVRNGFEDVEGQDET